MAKTKNEGASSKVVDNVKNIEGSDSFWKKNMMLIS